VLGSALGLGVLERRATAEEVPAAPIGPTTLKLHGRRRPTPARGALNGKANAGRTMRSGDLLDGPDGSLVGEFHANGFCLETALGLPAPAVSSLEFQTFQLSDGTLFGVGAPGGAGSERTWAVLGGTGRFAGARGTYVERDLSVAPVGRGAVEFILTLSA
jgi:hypothetical protein